MFGSRDVWFVVGLPVFLYAQGWRYMEVAGFLASWTIGYGLVQAVAPSVIRRSPDGLSREVPEARLWGAVLAAIPFCLALSSKPSAAAAGYGCRDRPRRFGFAFAVVSSLHSYLILAYAGSEKAAEDVGFYYAANAGGRLMGILLSGALMQAGGIAACLMGFRHHARALSCGDLPAADRRRCPAARRLGPKTASATDAELGHVGGVYSALLNER